MAFLKWSKNSIVYTALWLVDVVIFLINRVIIITGCVRWTWTLNHFSFYRSIQLYFIQKHNKTTKKNKNNDWLLKMGTFCFDTGLQTLREVVHSLRQCFHRDFVPCRVELTLDDGLRWVIPLARWMFFRFRALFSGLLFGLFLCLPVSS